MLDGKKSPLNTQLYSLVIKDLTNPRSILIPYFMDISALQVQNTSTEINWGNS